MKKKKFTRNLQEIPGTIYPNDVFVFKGFTFEEAKADLLGICGEDYEIYINENTFSTPGHTIKTPQGLILIMLREDQRNEYDVIAHECFHATEFIMEYIGMPHSNDTSEAFAYLLGYFVKEITSDDK